MANRKILIVEDERIVAEDMKETLKNLGYTVPTIAISGELAIEKAGECRPDLVLMDIFLAGAMNGIEAAEKIRQLYSIPVIYLTAYADKQIMEKAKITEPYGYILKPYDERELHTAIEIALYKHDLDTKLKESEERYRGFVQNFLGIAFRRTMEFAPVFFHGAVEKITGYTEAELISGKPRWSELIYKEDLSAVKEPLEKLRLVPNFSAEREYRIITKDSRMRWVYELIQNVTDRNGVLQYIQGALYDITERKKAEEGIKKRDSILLAVGFAVEWFLRAPLLEEHEAELHEWGGKTDVQQILEQLGLAVDVSEVSIFKIHSGKDGTPFISMQHEWTAPGVHTYIRNPSFQNFPYTTGGLARWQDELIKGNCISGNIRGLPASEKKFLGDLGFASLAVVPIISKDKVWGFIAFLNKADREWSPEELDGLRIVANIVSMIIGYREREDK